MKIIVTTPINIDFTFLVLAGTKLENYPFYKALHSKGKHLFIEYDENNNNLLKTLIDLDQLGLSDIKTVEEFEEMFPQPYCEYKGDFNYERRTRKADKRRITRSKRKSYEIF